MVSEISTDSRKRLNFFRKRLDFLFLQKEEMQPYYSMKYLGLIFIRKGEEMYRWLIFKRDFFRRLQNVEKWWFSCVLIMLSDLGTHRYQFLSNDGQQLDQLVGYPFCQRTLILLDLNLSLQDYCLNYKGTWMSIHDRSVDREAIFVLGIHKAR